MEKENILEKTMKDYSKGIEALQIILIGIAALLVPTFLAKLLTIVFGQNSIITSNSQIIVGTIVNTALIVTAINVKGWKKIVSIITLPSISAILGGYVFKTASVYMIYMIPAIWIGNFALVYLYKVLLLKKKVNYFVTSAISIAVKVGIIFLGFNLINAFGIFPEKLVQNLQNSMGLVQIITGVIGAVITYTVYIANKRNIKEK